MTEPSSRERAHDGPLRGVDLERVPQRRFLASMARSLAPQRSLSLASRSLETSLRRRWGALLGVAAEDLLIFANPPAALGLIAAARLQPADVAVIAVPCSTDLPHAITARGATWVDAHRRLDGRLDVAALARQRRGVDHGVRAVARGRPGVADERDDRLPGLEGGPIRPRGIVRVLREDVQRDALERRGRPAVLSRSVARPHRARASVRILRGAADEAERQRGHVSSASEPAPGTVRGRRRAQKRGGARRALGKNEEKEPLSQTYVRRHDDLLGRADWENVPTRSLRGTRE